MKRCAILPVKRLSGAKSRLARAYPRAERRAVALALLEHTLAVVTRCAGIDDVLVAGADEPVAEMASRHGAIFLREGKGDGLNGALARAAAEAGRRGADEVIVLPIDLPLLNAAVVERMLRAHPAAPFLVIVPDRRGTGTNLLYFSPPESFPFRFGRGSLRRHAAAADAAGFRVRVRRVPDIALDADTPQDLAACLDHPGIEWLMKGQG
jgi:2-phospho-L-lactate guanylyltransferase